MTVRGRSKVVDMLLLLPMFERTKHTDTCLVAASFFCRCSMVSSATRIFLRASSSASFLLSFLSLSSSSRTRILSSSTWAVRDRGWTFNLHFCLNSLSLAAKEELFVTCKKRNCAKVGQRDNTPKNKPQL